jgi:hypothetical protein
LLCRDEEFGCSAVVRLDYLAVFDGEYWVVRSAQLQHTCSMRVSAVMKRNQGIPYPLVIASGLVAPAATVGWKPRTKIQSAMMEAHRAQVSASKHVMLRGLRKETDNIRGSPYDYSYVLLLCCTLSSCLFMRCVL